MKRWIALVLVFVLLVPSVAVGEKPSAKRYLLGRLAGCAEGQLPPSYDMAGRDDEFARVCGDIIYTYDAALMAISLLAAGEGEAALQVGDALLLAMGDEGVVHNGYRASDVTQLPGFAGSDGQWLQEEYSAAIHSGNVAWAMLALEGCYRLHRDKKYLVAALTLGAWIRDNCLDERGAGGFTGGEAAFGGGKLLYKSTEHNLDLYAALAGLGNLTSDDRWSDLCWRARNFAESMGDIEGGFYYTGTADDGVTINRDVIPLDCQTLQALAFQYYDEAMPALKYAEAHYRLDGGYDYNDDLDGVWYEGTAQMACAYKTLTKAKESAALLALLHAAQTPDGALPSASIDGLTTGFGSLYYKAPHIGATAWLLLAEQGANPLWLEVDGDPLPEGEPDKLGSWGSINQEIGRGADWKQIVASSPFQLGERRKMDYFDTDTEWYYEQDFGSYPRLDGSTVCVPLALEFARQHLGLEDEAAKYFVEFNTTHGAYVNLIDNTSGSYCGMVSLEPSVFLAENRPVDLILCTEPSDEERQLAKDTGIELVVKPICYDAFVFIVSRDNPVDGLTTEQIRRIYQGEITNWRELGGEDEAIVAYQREPNSGSQTTMEKQVMNGLQLMPAPMVSYDWGMGELVSAVGEFENRRQSIGYTFKFYIDVLYKNENIKVLSVDGVLPTPETIRSGEYPFATNYFGVIRDGEQERTGGKFLDWILSDEGQACVAQAGYVPLK